MAGRMYSLKPLYSPLHCALWRPAAALIRLTTEVYVPRIQKYLNQCKQEPGCEKQEHSTKNSVF